MKIKWAIGVFVVALFAWCVFGQPNIPPGGIALLIPNDPLVQFNGGTNRVPHETQVNYTASTFCWSLWNTGGVISLYNNGAFVSSLASGTGSVNAATAWRIQRHASNVVVALIDDGVDTHHPDLAGRFVPGWQHQPAWHDFTTEDYEHPPEPRSDVPPGKHGTLSAGMIGAIANNGIGGAGVCGFGVKLMPVVAGTWDGLAAAVEWAVTNGADVIHFPWGRVNSGSLPSWERAFALAAERDVLIVCAADNTDGANHDVSVDYPARYGFSNLLVLTASTPSDTHMGFAYSTNWIHAHAPGERHPSTMPGGGYAYWRGCSVSSAVGAGVAALVKARFPHLGGAALRSRIVDSVDRIPVLSGKSATGGRLNAFNALMLYEPMPRTFTLDPSAQWESAVDVMGPWQSWTETNIVATEPQRFFRRTL